MQIPLFPLNTVLFPGGVLPLRVFEARYMDMVRDCMQGDAPFGVCLITKGVEVGGLAHTEAVGCLASIRAWDMKQLGLLHLRTVGTQRFRIQRSHAQANGLVLGEVDLIDPDEDLPIEPEHQPCADLLARIIDDLGAQIAEKRRTSGEDGDVLGGMPFDTPFRMDSSVWVGNRLCEVLPVPLKAKQKLMELDDAHARLEIVSQYLRQHAVLK
jgi:Lon protease-like protein